MIISSSEALKNEEILARLEEQGGGSVWDAEVFTLIALDVALSDEQVAPLCELVGVQQIAINASALSTTMLRRLASIPGLSSLVIGGAVPTPDALESLRQSCPEVVVLADEA